MNSPTKQCTTCKLKKELSDFSKDKHKKDGLINKCKLCTNKHYKEHRRGYYVKYRKENREKIYAKNKAYLETPEGKVMQAKSSKKYAQTEHGKLMIKNNSIKHSKTIKGKLSQSKSTRKQKLKFPERAKAQSIWNHYREKNNIELPDNHVFHHWDYSQPLSTILLSIKNHRKIHENIIYDQFAHIFRTKQGELLDTERKHAAYLNLVLRLL